MKGRLVRATHTHIQRQAHVCIVGQTKFQGSEDENPGAEMLEVKTTICFPSLKQ